VLIILIPIEKEAPLFLEIPRNKEHRKKFGFIVKEPQIFFYKNHLLFSLSATIRLSARI
jgi:hypothetical protein